MLLLFLSGIPLAEQGFQKRYLSGENQDFEAYHDYLKYRKETSPLIPLPNVLYRNLPLVVKRIFFFDFPMYETKFYRDALEHPRTK